MTFDGPPCLGTLFAERQHENTQQKKEEAGRRVLDPEGSRDMMTMLSRSWNVVQYLASDHYLHGAVLTLLFPHAIVTFTSARPGRLYLNIKCLIEQT